MIVYRIKETCAQFRTINNIFNSPFKGRVKDKIKTTQDKITNKSNSVKDKGQEKKQAIKDKDQTKFKIKVMDQN